MSSLVSLSQSGGGVSPLHIDLFTGNAATWTNMPTAETQLFGNNNIASYRWADLTLYNTVRFAGGRNFGAATANAILVLQASLDAISWEDISDEISLSSQTTLQVSDATPIPETYRAEVYLRVAGRGGDGIQDPQMGVCQVIFTKV